MISLFISNFKKASQFKGISIIEKQTLTSSSAFIPLEHQIYQSLGIPALSLSARDYTGLTHRYQKYSVFDDKVSNLHDLRRNLLIISEALVKLIYEFKDHSINFFLDNESVVDMQYMEQIG